ncbi:MAG: protoporphyrinogen oxidase, partial [Deinococcales bacterium]
GRAFADALADAFVSGITAGDPRELSVDALFPRLRAMERAHGSLVKALVAGQRSARRKARERAREQAGAAPGSGSGGRLTSFRAGGMQRLLDALQGGLAGDVRLETRVEGLERRHGGAGYRLHLAGRGSGAAADLFDDVVLTVPTPAAADLLRAHSPAAADALAAIPYAGVRVFGLGFDRIDVPRVHDGFGFLVPRGQGVRSLGVLWTSTLYPQRAPEGKVLVRVLAGGRLDPAMLELEDAEALAVVRRDLRVTMGIVAEPEFVETVRWPQAIPQYTLGHPSRLAAVDQALADLPGLHLAGNAYHGVGVNDCVREAERVVGAMTGARKGGAPEDGT